MDPGQIRQVPWEDPLWIIELDGASVVLISKTGVNRAMLEWERRMLDALEQAEFPSSRAVPLFQGEDHTIVGDVSYIARSWIPGKTLVEYPAQDLAAVGWFIARFHEHTSGLDLPQRPGIGSLPEVLKAPSDTQLLITLGDAGSSGQYRKLVDDVAPLVADPSTDILAIHGDFTTRNIVATGSPPAIAGLIDFGMAMIASSTVELAYALGSTRESFASVEHRFDGVAELITGYASRRPLPDEAAPEIVDFARARPLLNIAVNALIGSRPRSSKALERVTWLTDHRAAMISSVEQGMAPKWLEEH